MKTSNVVELRQVGLRVRQQVRRVPVFRISLVPLTDGGHSIARATFDRRHDLVAQGEEQRPAEQRSVQSDVCQPSFKGEIHLTTCHSKDVVPSARAAVRHSQEKNGC